jgi:hypothetical protein
MKWPSFLDPYSALFLSLQSLFAYVVDKESEKFGTKEILKILMRLITNIMVVLPKSKATKLITSFSNPMRTLVLAKSKSARFA